MADQTEHGIPRAVAIAWGMHEVPERGPRRGLSHERIVRAAIEIADADGLAAVTMQRVAQSLKFTTMSLYRYVASKDELLTLMQDSALQLPAVQQWPPPGSWQDAIREWAGHLREAYRRRPWLLELPRSETGVLMPSAMEFADRGLAAMQPLRLNWEQKVAVVLNVSLMVAGYVRLEGELSDEDRVVLDEEAVALLGEVITAERYPTLAPLIQAGEYVGSADFGSSADVEVELALGLDWIIAGIERLDTAAAAADAQE